MLLAKLDRSQSGVLHTLQTRAVHATSSREVALKNQAMRIAWAVLLVACPAGCGSGQEQGDGLPREAVSGTVTLDGQPLSGASIQFVPDDPNAPGGTSGEVEEGKFIIERARGPVAGSYHVMISSRTGTKVDASQPPGEAPAPRKDPIPAKYNTKTELKVEVKAGGPNTYEFPLVSK